MKYFILWVVTLSAAVIACKQSQVKVEETNISETKEEPPPPPPQLSIISEYIITDSGFGLIKKSTTYTDLQKLFGAKNVTDAIEYGAEGEDSFKVTKIFQGTSKEITVGWKKGKLHKQIADAECTAEGSPYYTTDSLKIGSSLQKLLAVNGKPIKFYGTDWDYGGTITSFNKGKFEKATVFFQLGSMPGMNEKIMGDQEMNTDMPVVKSNLEKLSIVKITLSFDKTK